MEIGFLDGLANTLSLANLWYAFLGCLLGTAVGVLPGLGPSASMALLLPFSLGMPPVGAIILLAGIYYGASYGGSTTAILLNIPGEPSSIPTALDGYPMAKQGRAGQALAMAAIGSFMAGIFGAMCIALLGRPFASIALLFGPAEYFALVVFSLCALVSVAEASLMKGLVMVLVGMALASVGVDSMTGTPRLNFDTIALMQGFDLVSLLVGLFGVSEVLATAGSGVSSLSSKKLGNWWSMIPRGDELKQGLKASGRGTLLGFFLGLLPGMIPAVTSFISYDVEKRLSKDPGRFGKGAIEGVAAPEAANNATSMAGFIPLMAFGIPTTGSLAIVLAALMVNGLKPGPALFTDHALFTWTVIASMFVANCMLIVLNLPFVGAWARLCLVPYKYLAPIILAVCLVGAYSTRNSMFDVWVAMISGIIAYLLRKRQWPIGPLILAFLLGPMAEQSLRQSLALSDGSLLIFVERPYAGVLLLATLFVVVLGRLLRYKGTA